MAVDDRKLKRALLQWECDAGRCKIEVHGETFEFSRINDISAEGAGVALPLSLDAGTPVQVDIRPKDQALTIRGSIAWQHAHPIERDPLKTGTFLTGIQFYPQDKTIALKLFRALNDHSLLNEQCY